MSNAISCYRTIGGKVTNSGLNGTGVDYPCGEVNATNPVVPCCVAGDICLPDELCHYTHSLEGGSGYYVGSCTNETGQGAGCPNKCTGGGPFDVVYENSTGLWHCCGTMSGEVDCQNPTDETFVAPAPSELAYIVTVPATFSNATSTNSATKSSISNSSATTSTSASTTISSTPSPTNAAVSTTKTLSPLTSSPAPTTLSTSSKAGIGVGVSLAALLIIALSSYLLFNNRRRQKQRKSTQEVPPCDFVVPEESSQMPKFDVYGGMPRKEEGEVGVAEMGDGDGDRAVPELGDENRSIPELGDDQEARSRRHELAACDT